MPSEYGPDPDALADVSVKNRRHGARNPHAQFQAEVSREQVLGSRMIAAPLRLFECSPISDGAAAAVVSTLEWARGHADVPVEILACEQASGPTAAEDMREFTTFPSAVPARPAAADPHEAAAVHQSTGWATRSTLRRRRSRICAAG